MDKHQSLFKRLQLSSRSFIHNEGAELKQNQLKHHSVIIKACSTQVFPLVSDSHADCL